MRALLITALLASAHCYGPPQQPASAASQSRPTGLTEFCGTNCVQQQPQQSVHQQQQHQTVSQQVVSQQQVHHQAAAQSPPNYSNNPFLNGAVDLKRPPAPVVIPEVSQQVSQQQVSYQESYQPAPAPTRPNYSSNPFLSGQVGVTYSPKPCAINTLCVARAMCSAGVLRQEDVLQAKSQNQPCDQNRGETCCRVPDLVQQGAGASQSLVVQQSNQQQQFNNNNNNNNQRPRPTSTQRPYTGPLNTTPHIGCAAALLCVSLEYCNALGVVSDTPVILRRDDENRVPITECQNPETGDYGFCCRDPNYKDPWPETQELCDQGTSCEAMWSCSQERMALPKKGCRVNNDGSTGICCLPPRGGQQQQFSQQNQFSQSQQQLVSSNVIDSRPAYTSQQNVNAPRPPPPQPFVPPPRPQPVNVIPPVSKPAPQPSYPQQSYPAPQPVNVDSRPSQTQFFQQQSPSSINQFPIQAIKVPHTQSQTSTAANNQFPIQAIKVPAQSAQPAYQPPRPTTQQPPRYEAPVIIPAPTSGCGVRSVQPGTPQDGESQPGEFPWQALVIANDGARLCAGAVISESAILVSATCIQGRDSSQLKVEVGSWSPYSAAQERQIVPVMVSVIHPRFEATSQANDLAILVLRQSLRFGRFVGAVCLPRADELTSEGQLQQPGGSCLISSWPKPADSSSKLNRVAVRPVNSQQCEESLRSTYLGKYFQLHKSFMCAAPLDPQRDLCPVNLGGALVCPRSDGRYLVIGASSWDVGCTQSQPAVMCALDVLWVNQVLETPAQDLQQQQQQQQQQFVVAPQVAEQKPGFSQGYGR